MSVFRDSYEIATSFYDFAAANSRVVFPELKTHSQRCLYTEMAQKQKY